MHTHQPSIYFLCPDYRNAVGGIRIIYNHADILNANGFLAKVVHSKKGFRASWFPNHTEVTHIRAVRFQPYDIVVLPEIFASYYNNQSLPDWKLKLKKRFSQNRLKYYLSEIANLPVYKVIYNQNAYATFHQYPYVKNDWYVPYFQPDVIRTVVVSNDNADYLTYTFPEHRFERVHVSFDFSLFTYASRKKPQICFMPRKNDSEARQVINILQAKGLLADFDVIAIEGKTTDEVAAILKESLIFMSFGYPEGSPLPPCEAMLSGCIVVGYHGWGGREYFRPEFCYPVEPGDVLTFARRMEEVIRLYHKQPD